MIKESASIYEFDVERDRKACIALDLDVAGANRELAQWLMDHPRYSESVVSGWLGCSKSRVGYLRRWATTGFDGSPFDQHHQPNKNSSRGDHDHGQGALETNNKFQDDTVEPDENVEEPKKVLMNVLDSIKQSRAVAEAYRKILRVSPFDRAAKKEISEAIDSLIRKWRSVQSTLTTKGKADVE